MARCLCDGPGHCFRHDLVVSKDEFASCQLGDAPNRQREGKPPCVYLAGRHKRDIEKSPAYDCNRHGKCTLEPNGAGEPNCADCKDYLRLDDPEFQTKFVDPLYVVDREKRPTKALENMLAGKPAFLVCGGPSVKQIDYGRLAERGVFSLGVNNIAGMAPVNAFVCSDPPMKFHPGIFLDPCVMKFLPSPKIGKSKHRGRLREKRDGKFFWMPPHINTREYCPNVWGFERRSWMMPDETFFLHRAASWGNQDAGVKKTGLKKVACTMLLGLRLLYYLGARKIFLLGVDFLMRDDVGETDNYAFDEERDAGAILSNNRHYVIVNDWLCAMADTFSHFGVSIYNCCRESGLRAFPFVPFERALEICRGDVPAGEFDLHGWYTKETEPE